MNASDRSSANLSTGETAVKVVAGFPIRMDAVVAREEEMHFPSAQIRGVNGFGRPVYREVVDLYFIKRIVSLFFCPEVEKIINKKE